MRVTMNFAPMGWAIGGAIGTALANRSVPVVCITGDGSLLMNGQEMSVAQTEKLTVLFVILNDAALGMVKHGQRMAGAEQIAFELPTVDFKMMAESMGFAPQRISRIWTWMRSCVILARPCWTFVLIKMKHRPWSFGSGLWAGKTGMGNIITRIWQG